MVVPLLIYYVYILVLSLTLVADADDGDTMLMHNRGVRSLIPVKFRTAALTACGIISV